MSTLGIDVTPADGAALRRELIAEEVRKEKYGALGAIAVLLKAFAVLGLLSCIAAVVVNWNADRNELLIESLGAAAAALVVGLLLWAGGDLINLLIAIERNTRRASYR
jgi:hypothetical protein